MKTLLILLVSVGFPIIALLGFIGLGLLLAVVIDEWFEMLIKKD